MRARREWLLALAIIALAVLTVFLPDPWRTLASAAAPLLVLAWLLAQRDVRGSGVAAAIMLVLVAIPTVGYILGQGATAYGPFLIGIPLVALAVVAARLALTIARRR